MLQKFLKLIRKIFGWFFTTSWKNRIFIIVLLLIAGFFISRKTASDKKSGYIMGVAELRTITEMVTESGTVTTTGRVNVYSPTNGIIEEVFVSNGDSVSAGQKLFTVKSTATPQEKAAALAAFQSARSAVQQAENIRRSTSATVDRVHDDLKNNDKDETFLEKETRTTAEVANDNAYDTLLSARAQLVSAQTAYQATQNSTVTALVSGRISNLSVTDGSNVSANSPLVPAPPVLIIGGLGSTEILITVGESDINKIRSGQAVSIKLDAVNDRIYQGVIRRFDETGTLDQGVAKFNVYIEVVDPGDLLKTGMSADVDIITNQMTDVLSVQNTAIKPYQKGRAVRKLTSDGKLEFIPVKIGLRGKEFTQIVEGLQEGQEVVVSLTNEKSARTSPFGF